MTRARPGPRPRRLLVVVAIVFALFGCSSTSSGSSSSSTRGPDTPAVPGSTVVAPAAPPCPVASVPIVVAVDQWKDMVQQLAGQCGTVSAIITGSSGDPHTYEPTPADNATFSSAKLVLVNGVGYDGWASKALEVSSSKPVVVDAGETVGRHEGDNPHVWYDPAAVQEVADAVTAALRPLLPGAEAYLDERATAWKQHVKPYTDLVATMKTAHDDEAYAATESVFDDMAGAVGLQNRTPEGYRSAADNESDPAPGDIAEFERMIQDGQIDVLVYNAQTEGAVPEQLRATAESAGVPVVEVTETVPPGESSFVNWQLQQLHRLDQALAGSK